MWADPLLWATGGGDDLVGAHTVDIVVPDGEIWRIRAWQATQGQGTTITMNVTPPSGKTGGILQIAVAVQPLPTIATVTFPRGPTAGMGAAADDALIRYGGLYVDLLPGWIARTVFLGAPGGGTVLIGYERITNERIQAQYGPSASINFQNGEVRYPRVPGPGQPQVVPVG